MSFKIKNAEFVNKKVYPQKVNFELNSGEVISVVIGEEKVKSTFKNILAGKYLVKNGQFKIDGFDKVNKQWTKRKVAVIKPGNKLIRRWPEKFWLYWSLLLNKNFYTNAKINYINTKYSYLSFSTSNNNKTDLDMRDKVEEMISKFIVNSTEVEEQWLDQFLEQIVEFNDVKLEKNYGTLDEHIRIIVKDYYYLIEKNHNLELLQTFLQSLWDKVYSFLELSSLCTCEYNAKKSKDKFVKKKAKYLAFTEQNFVVRKQLKIIDLKINTIKRKISKNKFIIKSLEKQIKFEVSKSSSIKAKRIKEIDHLFNWRQLAYDQRFEFRQKQEKMFFEALFDEATILRGKIVEVMHQYHQKVLHDTVKDGNMKEFRDEKQKYRKAITTVYSQASGWINSTADQLEMSFDFIQSTFKFTAINTVYFKLLESIYMKKHNIIFYNVLAKLSKEDCQQLIKIVNNLQKIDKRFCAIFLESKIENIHDLTKEVVVIENGNIKETKFSDLLKNEWNTYGSQIFYNKNRIAYEFDGKNLQLVNQKVKVLDGDYSSEGFLLIDPFKIYTNKKNLKNIILEADVIVKETDDFKDDKVYELILKNGTRLFFYSDKKLEHKSKMTIYICEDSILKKI
ncbi:P-loop NTPase family protein [Spiroplasma culicicola]|uniref:Uncharacterized protein n=1 Tax=Spiroplasma culicicola AES-1 TaxID=1276246 RepID=W6A901_9MOLU|nr:hypothetical protein [Spiroplasma culicicola]AHI53370.1 hypothetical protein SCULI_v1c10300 [Spiroplasma culicicola AES-1]